MKEKLTHKKPQNDVVQSIIDIPPSKTDPDGSYTGKPVQRYETPIQDADDL